MVALGHAIEAGLSERTVCRIEQGASALRVTFEAIRCALLREYASRGGTPACQEGVPCSEATSRVGT